MKNQFKGLTKGNAKALKALGVTKIKDGFRSTKAFRFTLPIDLAVMLESMTKEERDSLLIKTLEIKCKPLSDE